jgi:25S rRNA (adenine2142-N1)-methyltransferase
MTLEHMKGLMDAIGFSQLEERWKPGGKMIYWLYQKRAAVAEGSVGEHFRRKKVLRQGGHRNNFCVEMSRDSPDQVRADQLCSPV